MLGEDELTRLMAGEVVTCEVPEVRRGNASSGGEVVRSATAVQLALSDIGWDRMAHALTTAMERSYRPT